MMNIKKVYIFIDTRVLNLGFSIRMKISLLYVQVFIVNDVRICLTCNITRAVINKKNEVVYLIKLIT